MIDRIRLTATVTGSAGSAAGSATTSRPIFGCVKAVYVGYTSQPSTTDVTITATNPTLSILTLTNKNTTGWFFPQVLADDTSGVDLTAWYTEIVVSGPLSLSVAQGDPGTVDVYIVVEC